MPGSSPSSLPSGMAQWNPWTEQPAKHTVHNPPGLRSALNTTAKCRRTDLKCQTHFHYTDGRLSGDGRQRRQRQEEREKILQRWREQPRHQRNGLHPWRVSQVAHPCNGPRLSFPSLVHSVADGRAMHTCPGNRSTYASPMASLSTSAPCAPTSSVTPRSYSSEACAASPRFSLPAGQIQGSTMWGRWPGAVRMN